VVGDPDFDLTRRSPAAARPSAARRLRGDDASCFDPAAARFEPLPFSRLEANQILEAWTRAGGQGKVIVGPDATAAAFRNHAPGNRILHLATHGFFYPSRCGAANPATAAPIAGLALAGANRPAGDEQTGVLTADDISVMPLDHTEWAVLSGCDTGLGKIEAGEGVFGLRRAFQLAGARTIIMSLWPVQD
jgi:CHAT domain-containing protein